MSIRRSLVVAFLIAVAATPSCTCSDGLTSAKGQLALALCDRGETCGCADVPLSGGTIELGAPAPGTLGRRTLRLTNANAPRRLVIESLAIEGDASVFGIQGVLWRESDAASARAESHDFRRGPLVLEHDEVADVTLAVRPEASGTLEATLVITSNSEAGAVTRVLLIGGAGSATTCAPGNLCGAAAAIDFGTFPVAVVSSAFDEVRELVVTNHGDTQLFVEVELVNDGVPETQVGERPGAFGIFFVGELGCTSLAPGATLAVPVHYRPFRAGSHHGELALRAAGEPVRVPLDGKVIGPALCLRTEDAAPSDTRLTFGDPPENLTPLNAPEQRRAWLSNCGVEEALVVSSIAPAPGSSSEFGAAVLPLTTPWTIAAGAEVELLARYAPAASAVVGSLSAARWLISSNDPLRPTGALDLEGRVGPPERCVLIPTVNPLDFGWVAQDEAEQGTVCPPFGLGCTPNEKLSRQKTLQLVNVGQRPCTAIQLGAWEFAPGSEGTFSLAANGNPASFDLAPGASSQPLTFLFVTDPAPTPVLHRARLFYDSPDIELGPLKLELQAKAGGSPHCDLEFAPVSGPTFFCSLESLAFGNVNYGTAKTIELRLRNVGSETCQVSNFRPAAGTSAVFGIPNPTLAIPPGEAATLPVTFTPMPPTSDLGLEQLPFLCGQNGLLMTANTGPGGAPQDEKLALSGQGVRPSIDVIPGAIDFGLVTVGCCSAERRVAIYNSGSATLTLSSTSIGASSDAGFTVTRGPSATTIPQGGNAELFVRYCATAVGDASGVLEITGADDNQEYFAVSLAAEGTTSSEGHDGWQQPWRPTVDVLWVVDDSGSMGEEQDTLADNFGSFIQTATELDTDYNLGVVSTDVESAYAGQLYHCNANRFLRDEQPNSEEQNEFRCNVKTSESDRPHSDNKEAALQAARLALDFPNVQNYNVGFLRPEAKLYVILVTDELDQSDGTPQQYVDFLRNLKGLGNADLLNLSAISGPPGADCSTADENDFDFEAVTLAGGQFRSICSADWSDMISGLGLDVFNARRQFPLSRPATASTLVVRVCADSSGTPSGCVIVPQDPTNGWTYDAATNAVVFHGTSIPGRGAHVQIEYVAACF